MARINGVQQADAGLKVKLVYRLGPRMMKKLTGRAPQTGSGLEPEEIYRRLYASLPVGRLHLLRDALATLEVDPEYGLSWISVAAGAPEQYGLRAEDLEGIAEHPRSIGGTKLALFFRDLGHNRIKVSFRSTGGVDVNAFAKQFSGGGHARAAGALITGSLEEVQHSVVAAARQFLAAAEKKPE